MADLHKAGGTPPVLKRMLRAGLLHGDCLTCTGRSLAENLREVPDLSDSQDVVRKVSEPIKASGHIHVLRGNLAPEGAVSKLTGKEGISFRGPAACFDSEEAMLRVRACVELRMGARRSPAQMPRVTRAPHLGCAFAGRHPQRPAKRAGSLAVVWS